MKLQLSKKQAIAIIAIVAISLLVGNLILRTGRQPAQGEGHGHGSHAETQGHGDTEHHGGKGGDGHNHANEHADSEHHEETVKGPHGGKLLTEEDIGIEVVLAEKGGEPRFHVYLFQKDKPLAPTAAKLSITLTRPDGEQQEIGFFPEKDYLKSIAPVAEPHVFDATAALQVGSDPFLFTFSEEEGKIALSDEQVKVAGIMLQTAGAARIKSTLSLPAEIRFNEDRTAHVVPRLTGVVESVLANLGQRVRKGQVLAVIASTGLSEQRSELLAAQKRLTLATTTYAREKKLWQDKISAEQDYLQAQQALHEAEIAVQNATQKLTALGASAASNGALNRYELRAPFDGMVVEKHISLGESVKEDANVFVVSDLSTVWAEVAVPPKDLNAVRVGEKVTVKATAFDSSAAGTIAYVGALVGEQTRSATARVVLANPQLAWRPGLSVNVEIVSDETDVAVAVSADAVQSINDKPTVFVKTPGGFLPQAVVLGKANGKQVEVVRGLKPGTPYAAAGSFVIKSELGKGSATHSH